MKKFTSFYSAIIFMIISGAASAASLDGTASVKYQTSPYVFRDGDTVRGIVCFGKGFTVVPGTNHGSNLFLDTNISISGGIDLRGTSTMTLLHDVWLDSGVTFSDSGRIYSYGSSLIMGGDLTIPADKVLHCGGNLIIDGKGHTLTLGSGAQLFLDNASTLTLRNMVVKTTHQYPGAPALTLSSTFSKLALDNVMLALSDDFYVNRGQLFIHNDVMVTGTSALVYRSTSPSVIASQGCLFFDNGTTFSYAPATNNKDLMLMADASSSLVLDGCSLKTTHTGMRLTKGRLYMDNKIQCDSSSVNKLNAVSLITSQDYGSGIAYSVSWSPDGKYVAIVGSGSPALRVYRFNGVTLVSVATFASGSARTLSWSSDGRYIAVGGDSPIKIYSFNGSSLVSVTTKACGSGEIFSVSWSPDGQYLAIGCQSPTNGNEFQIYRFDGLRLTLVTSQDYGSAVFTTAWAPDGKYVAIGGSPATMFGGVASTDTFQIYRFDGSLLTAVVSAAYGDQLMSVSWSPDGLYVAVFGWSSQPVKIYRFDGRTLTLITSQLFGNFPRWVSWSPDGRYIGIGGQAPSTFGGAANSDEFQIYRFDGIRLTAIISQNYGLAILSIAWSPDGKYVAICGETPLNSNELWIDRCLYKNETATQPMDKSIVWGNSAAGAASDLDIHILSDARVEVSGKVFHDPA